MSAISIGGLLYAGRTPAAIAPTVKLWWRTDLAAARAEAAAGGKDLLIEFTVGNGTTRSPLDQGVFDTNEFLVATSARFVPVRLAVSTDAAGSGPADAAIVTLARRYEVARIPSIVLADAKGRPYASVESDADSIDTYLKLIEQESARRPARDAALALAANSTGAARAKHLDVALGAVGRFASTAEYEDVARDIVAADPMNEAGLKAKYGGGLTERRIDEAIQSRVYPLIDRADFRGAIAAIDQILAEETPVGEHAQLLTAFKGQLFASLGQASAASQALERALALAPSGAAAERIRQQLEDLRSPRP